MYGGEALVGDLMYGGEALVGDLMYGGEALVGDLTRFYALVSLILAFCCFMYICMCVE